MTRRERLAVLLGQLACAAGLHRYRIVGVVDIRGPHWRWRCTRCKRLARRERAGR